jgi:hypothetical protein
VGEVTVIPRTGTRTVFEQPSIQDHPSMSNPQIAAAVERNLARRNGVRPGSAEEKKIIAKIDEQRDEAILFDTSTRAERAARARRKAGWSRAAEARIRGAHWRG